MGKQETWKKNMLHVVKNVELDIEMVLQDFSAPFQDLTSETVDRLAVYGHASQSICLKTTVK